MVSPVESSNIGRRSALSKSNADVSASFHKRKESETLNCIILDICGAYKPTSIFFPEADFGELIFQYSNIFILGIMEHNTVAATPWRGSIDELRMNYGVDENIVGRECVCFCKSITRHDIFNGEVQFLESLNSYQPDHSIAEYHSLSFMGGISADYNAQLRAKKRNPNSGSGERWIYFKT
jgi:hypothetical protein